MSCVTEGQDKGSYRYSTYLSFSGDPVKRADRYLRWREEWRKGRGADKIDLFYLRSLFLLGRRGMMGKKWWAGEWCAKTSRCWWGETHDLQQHPHCVYNTVIFISYCRFIMFRCYTQSDWAFFRAGGFIFGRKMFYTYFCWFCFYLGSVLLPAMIKGAFWMG